MTRKYSFKLRFNKKAVKKLAGRYPREYDAELEDGLGLLVKARGYLLKPEFERFCRWKTPRNQSRVASNPAEYIEAVTQTALSTPKIFE